jgi:hypothetical protein
MQASSVDLFTPGRQISGSSLPGAVRFEFAGREFADDGVASFDFGPISNQNGVEISGLIGYPLLSRSTVTINLRDGLMEMGR